MSSRKIMKNPDSESLFGDDHGEDTYHFWDVESLNPSNQYMILIVMVGLWHLGFATLKNHTSISMISEYIYITYTYTYIYRYVKNNTVLIQDKP